MKTTFALLLFVLIAGPAVGFRSSPQDYGQPTELADLPGMSAEGTKYMLGVHEVDGVNAVAYLNDVKNKMVKYGLKQTHHIMVAFTDNFSGESIESGSVAVKVEDPEGQISSTIKLLGMEGSFGADITIDKKGMYQFKIGTELADGKKRIFHLHFVNK